MQIQNHLFIFSGLLIVIALFIYKFVPKLRKNSFQMEVSEDTKNDFSKNISDLFTPLEQRYAEELASGEAILIKATGKNNGWQDLKALAWIIAGVLSLVFLINHFFSVINEYFNHCLSNIFTIGIIWWSLVFLSIMSNLKVKLSEYITNIKVGRKTGWDGDIHKEYDRDTVIFKYTKAKEREYFFGVCSLIVFGLFIIPVVFFPIFSIEPISFVKIQDAFGQCIGK